MEAVVFHAWQHEPEVRDVPAPVPGPGQVLVKVGGAGVCHSDLHIMEWPDNPALAGFRLPFVLGHEVAGWVAGVGAGVEGWSEGDPVAVLCMWGCGSCRQCAMGNDNYCEQLDASGQPAGGGIGFDGGMADYMVVPHPRFLVPLGEVDPVVAAPLTDAALTPYHAIKRSLPDLVPGSSTVVVGVGGLGHVAVQLLKALSATRVVAVDTAEDKLALARAGGADDTVRSGPDAAAQVRDLVGPAGARLVLDFVGVDETAALGASLLGRDSCLAIVGAAGGTLSFTPGLTIPYGSRAWAPLWGTAAELREVLALAATGAVSVEIERHPLSAAVDVYRKLRAGEVRGRAVLVPGA